ncbi:MAG: glycosyl hydrolase, partial [Flavobacteriaceae bacterium]|nr:glycosyl hydrolase [Flavobacteriaceae bacterium]
MTYRKEQQINVLQKQFLASLVNNKDYPVQAASEVDLKELFNEIMNNGMHGLCFSMYEDGQEPGDHISEEQVLRRMKTLQPHIKWIRSFSCIEGNEFVPKVAKKLG